MPLRDTNDQSKIIIIHPVPKFIDRIQHSFDENGAVQIFYSESREKNILRIDLVFKIVDIYFNDSVRYRVR
jgi:hypothetical protein